MREPTVWQPLGQGGGRIGLSGWSWWIWIAVTPLCTLACALAVEGSAFFVPLLAWSVASRWVPPLATVQVVGLSLVASALGPGGALVSYARLGCVRWRTGVLLALGALPAALLGALAGPLLPTPARWPATALVLLLAVGPTRAVRRLAGPPPDGWRKTVPGREWVLYAAGGLLTGLVGFGVGAILRPGLERIGLPPEAAAGTGMVVLICVLLGAGLTNLAWAPPSPYGLWAWPVLVPSALGVLTGGQLSPYLAKRLPAGSDTRIAGAFLALLAAADITYWLRSVLHP